MKLSQTGSKSGARSSTRSTPKLGGERTHQLIALQAFDDWMRPVCSSWVLQPSSSDTKATGRALWVFSSSRDVPGAVTVLSASGLKIQGDSWRTGSTHPLWGKVQPGYVVAGSMTYQEYLLGCLRLAEAAETGRVELESTTSDSDPSKPSPSSSDGGPPSTGL